MFGIRFGGSCLEFGFGILVWDSDFGSRFAIKVRDSCLAFRYGIQDWDSAFIFR